MYIQSKIKNAGIRVNLDLRNEKISYKIRENSLQKIPYLIIIGKKEMEEKSVTLRSFGSKEQEIIKFDNLTDFFKKKCIIPVH